MSNELEPRNHLETFYAAISGDYEDPLGEPRNRTEEYLKKIHDQGGGGGGGGDAYTKAESDAIFTRKATTINNKPLSSNITLNASDVGALPDSTTIPSKLTDLEPDGDFVQDANYVHITVDSSMLDNSSNPVQSKVLRDFVNSSISSNTAYYISDNGHPFESIEALEAYSGTVTNNDYAFVKSTDASGYVTFIRYKYNSNLQQWAVEYEVNNTSYTDSQWKAINSGVNSSKRETYDSHLTDTNNPHNVTAALIGAYSKPSSGIPKTDLASDVRAILDMGQVHNVSVLALSPFQKGRITNGTVYTDYKYRCISTNIIYTERDITLSISNTSYKFSIQKYNSSGSYISGSDSGWITTSISITANTYFRIMIARATESTTVNKEPIDVAYMASLVKCTYAYLSIPDNVINALSISNMQAYNSLSARLDAHLQAMNAIGRNVLYTGINAPTTGSTALTKGTVIEINGGTVTVNEDWSFTINGTISGASVPVSNLYNGSRTTDSAQKITRNGLEMVSTL